MSALGPMYDIPVLIRHGIKELFDNNNSEKTEYVIEKVRNGLNEYANELTPSELEKVMNYLSSIIECLNEILNGFSSLGIKVLKNGREELKREIEEVEREDTGVQKFGKNIFNDYEYSLAFNIKLISSALNVVNIAKEEIAKHLPEVCVYNNADGVVLRKIVGNIDE